jgi:hypothetical protein
VFNVSFVAVRRRVAVLPPESRTRRATGHRLSPAAYAVTSAVYGDGLTARARAHEPPEPGGVRADLCLAA